MQILLNDGEAKLHELMWARQPGSGHRYMRLLACGARDADLPWSCGYVFHMFHYHHPWTHRGYLTHKSAADELAGLFTIGQNWWTLGRRDRAIYQLGRMLHLIQDIFIPQHAAVTAVRGHGQLENWLDENWRRFVVGEGGCYSWQRTVVGKDGRKNHVVSSKNPYDWVDAGSHISYQWYRKHFEGGEYEVGEFSRLASKIIPYTLRYSAGFIRRFFVGLAF